MTPQTYVFIGRSGCGKGTQAELLKKHILDSNGLSIFYLETGARFREFVERDGITPERSKELMLRSERQPDFLAIWMWAHFFIGISELNQHWIIDGTPRSLSEAMTLDSAFRFYSRQKPRVVHINVSRGWSEERLKARRRADDATPGDIAKRMAWFEEDVMPAIDYYRNHAGYDFIEVNGEQTIPEVWQELLQKVTVLG